MGVPGKILVIKPSSLGDVAHVFPALEILRRSFPDSELDFVIHPAFAGLLDLSPFPVRKKILFDRKKLSSVSGFFPALYKLVRDIRAEQYELVVDFQGLLRSAFMVMASKSCITAGFASPREKFASAAYSKKIDVKMDQHAVERYVELANKICGTNFSVPELKVPAIKLDGELEKMLPEKFIVLVPGARWESKVFPPELFADSVKYLQKEFPELKGVIAGSSTDKKMADEIRKIIPDAVDLTGKTSLLQLAEVMRRAKAVLTNDSGPMHVAAISGTKIFALFGPTDPGLTGPYGRDHLILRHETLECLNCMKKRCPVSEAPKCHMIEPQKIAEKIAAYLRENF